jgi:hypothetical protein
MGEENRRKKEKKKKCVDHGREKGETKLVRELVSEYYSSKLVSIFTHQNFLVKMVRLSIPSSLTKIAKKLLW